MYSLEKAKQVGLLYGLWSVLMMLGLCILALIISMYFIIDHLASSVVSVFFILFQDRLLETLLGLSALALVAWKMCPRAGVKILVEEEEYAKEGCLAIVASYAALAFVMVAVNYVREGIKLSSNFGQVVDHLIFPLGWALIIGFIPMAVAGIWLGSKIDGQR